MLNRISNYLLAIGFALMVAVVVSDQVPYSLACFQPDRHARHLCHVHMSSASFMSYMDSLPGADPVYLEKNEEDLVKNYKQALQAGAVPPGSPGPMEFRLMLRSLAWEKLGQPI